MNYQYIHLFTIFLRICQILHWPCIQIFFSTSRTLLALSYTRSKGISRKRFMKFSMDLKSTLRMKMEGSWRRNKENTSKGKSCSLPKFIFQQHIGKELFLKCFPGEPHQPLNRGDLGVNDFKWSFLPSYLPASFLSFLILLSSLLSFSCPLVFFWKFKSQVSVNLFTSVKNIYFAHIYTFLYNISLPFVCHMALPSTSFKYLKDRVNKAFLLISSLFYQLHI